MGTATVIFKNRADALKALNQYNKVALDGKKLEIALVEERVVARLASGIRYGGKCGIRCGEGTVEYCVKVVGGDAGGCLWDQVCVGGWGAQKVWGGVCGGGLPLGSGGEGRVRGEVGKGLRSMPPCLPPYAPVEMGGQRHALVNNPCLEEQCHYFNHSDRFC